jgi:hypothetical protein
MPPSKPPKPKPPQVPGYVSLRVPATDKLLVHLENLGARSHRGPSPWGLSTVLRSQWDLFLASLEESDPRSTRDFPQEYYDLTIAVLTVPWELNARMIRVLPTYIQAQDDFAQLLQAAGVERAAYLQAIDELSFAERLHLVEAAQMHHAPRADPTTPDL